MVAGQRPQIVGVACKHDATAEPHCRSHDQGVDDMARVEAISCEQPGGDARHRPAGRDHADPRSGDHTVDCGVVGATSVDLDQDGARYDDVMTAALGGSKERPNALRPLGSWPSPGQAPQGLAV